MTEATTRSPNPNQSASSETLIALRGISRLHDGGAIVALRNVELTREIGATELLKVGKVIDREVAIAAGRAGIVIGSGRIDSPPAGYGVFGGAPAAASNRTSGTSRSRARAGLNRDYLKSGTSPFPIPAPILNRPR